MEKLKMHTPDLTQDHIARIRELFPNCVTEARDESGKLKLAVDFDQLKQELSDSIVEGAQERYHLNWPGKREALLTANAPIAKTLRPLVGESVSFDTTKNLFIEGDNLEALKLLQETYLGKVKMIYIDPPYNTGGDFIYEDNFAETTKEFLQKSNQKDDLGNRLIANTEANGRFHSDWLTMIYPRLKLARNLLADDGVIFVSIDVHEVSNLKAVMDEIFGETCHKNNIAVRRGIKNVQAQFEDISALSLGHEYVLAYSKNSYTRLPKLMLSHETEKPGKWDTFWRGTDRPTMRYNLLGVNPEKGQWRWEEDRANQAVKNHQIYLESHSKHLTLDEWYIDNLTATNEKLNFVRKNEEGVIQYYVPPSGGKLLSDNWMDITLSGNETIFDTEKSLDLLNRAIGWICCSDQESIILDFFAGSGTTADSVFRLNAADGGNRKFIIVQIDELCSEKSEAKKAGYKTISQITKKRISDAGKAVLEGHSHENWNKDIGFRVLKIDTSNMAEVHYTPDGVKQDDLLAAVDNIRPDRSPEDLLFQVLLDWGVDLTLPIAKKTVQGKTVFFVDGNALVACFDAGITEELVKELAADKPLRVVFRDNGFASDSVKINAEQIFKQMSPGTDMKSL